MQQQTQSQRQSLKFSPLQIQFLNFLQLSSLELETYIKNELEENPALDEGKEETPAESQEAQDEWDEGTPETAAGEETVLQDYYDFETLDNDDIPSYKTRVDNHSEDDEYISTPMVQTKTFQEELHEQLHWLSLSERQLMLAEYILNSIDEDGFLRFTLEDLADDLSFAHNTLVDADELEELLHVIQQLDPPGIGSRNLQECLLLQLRHRARQGEDVALACQLVENHIHEITQKNYNKILRMTGMEHEEFKGALHQITRLNPKPLVGYNDSSAHHNTVYPEFILSYQDGHLEVTLNGSKNAPELRLNSALLSMAQKAPRSAAPFVKSKIQAARWLMQAIKQRENTMMRVIKTIITLQPEYFITGDLRKLKPMILKDVADIILMDISTVSRVTSNKYIQTPFGTVLLKGLFSEGIKNQDGKEVSNREIQQHLAELVTQEEKLQPLSDQQLAVLLAGRGYPIARRTVAKYREHLDIPAAPLRREWN